jgi:formyltetrahydrofolate-dependent phosphoribosylglycinamide formyltransferase
MRALRDDGMAESEPNEAPYVVKLAVLISGTGRTLANLIEKIGAGALSTEIVAVVSSRAGVRGIELAEAAGIPTFVVTRKPYPDDAAFSEAIYAAIAPYEPDLVICAGFMKRLVVPTAWEGRILNIHPCLIPESNAAGLGFYGDRVHQTVIDCGATSSGATVHVVDNEYDHGPIVMKETVPVLPDDTASDLAARVFALECDLYPRAIAHYLAEHPDLIRRSGRSDWR